MTLTMDAIQATAAAATTLEVKILYYHIKRHWVRLQAIWISYIS